MTPAETAKVSEVLAMLRRSNSMHMAGDNEKAIDQERKARLMLVELLQSNGVDTDALK